MKALSADLCDIESRFREVEDLHTSLRNENVILKENTAQWQEGLDKLAHLEKPGRRGSWSQSTYEFALDKAKDKVEVARRNVELAKQHVKEAERDLDEFHRDAAVSAQGIIKLEEILARITDFIKTHEPWVFEEEDDEPGPYMHVKEMSDFRGYQSLVQGFFKRYPLHTGLARMTAYHLDDSLWDMGDLIARSRSSVNGELHRLHMLWARRYQIKVNKTETALAEAETEYLATTREHDRPTEPDRPQMLPETLLEPEKTLRASPSDVLNETEPALESTQTLRPVKTWSLDDWSWRE